MHTYRVSFYNHLVNDQGRCCKVLQRVLRIDDACDAAEAEYRAERQFEELEGVPDWRLRARLLEIERLEDEVLD